ncbi:MAG TPA: 3-dehydroquinate synthase [Candidatus Limnocylindria bacterium]|nr:3-dehydroquinate synthase [Candidatus Limnocylindria bacterium]
MYIFLVGPPGIGKSTLAPVLATRLAASVFEIDRAVERRARKSNKDTIEQDGIERFRDLESRALHGLPATPAWCVVDTGGGTPLRTENRKRMRELGLIVGLRAPLARVTAGIAATMAKRPDQSLSPRDRARHALSDPERKAAYRDVDVTFDVGGASPDETADAIVAWLAASRGLRVDVGERRAPIVIRAGLLDVVGTYVAELGWTGRVALVTEPTAGARLAGRVRASLVGAGLDVTVVPAPTGEAAKTIGAVASLWHAFAEAGIGRDGGVVALGGGSIGDAAGFAAATYLRGVPVVQVPTTLLAMVDASIGGKTAIDIAAGKNLVGAFHSPAAVLVDPVALATLPRRQRSAGLAEVIKTAFLVDRESVAHVERAIPGVLAGALGPTLTAVTLAVEVKASVVTADPLEHGLRALLNFGHTMGHAYEAASRYRVTHGEAVALGMVYACALAERLGLAPVALRADVERLLTKAGLPVRGRIPPAAWTLLARDKKVRAGKVRWVLPRRIGRFSLVTDVGAAALRAAGRVVEGS